MINLTKFISVLLLFALLNACTSKQESVPYERLFNDSIQRGLPSIISHAKGFSVYQLDSVFRLDIYQPNLGQNIAATYYLSKKFSEQELAAHNNYLKIPLDSVAVFSGTQINAFERLGLLESIVGISEARYIINPDIAERLEEGSIMELSNSGSFYLERTLMLNPQLIFYSPYKFNEVHPLAAAKITMVPFFDFREKDPLGRAEWVKFTALFYDQMEEASELFQHIVTQYESYAAMVAEVEYRPTVFADKYFNGQWYVPGGQSYVAKLFFDSGSDYLWADDPHTGSFPLDYEVVFAKAHDADFWRILGSYGDTPSYAALESENGLYRHFKAFKNKQIIHCDAQATAFFETSPLEPQLVLADLIKAFHPELLPDYHAKYYKVLLKE